MAIKSRQTARHTVRLTDRLAYGQPETEKDKQTIYRHRNRHIDRKIDIHRNRQINIHRNKQLNI